MHTHTFAWYREKQVLDIQAGFSSGCDTHIHGVRESPLKAAAETENIFRRLGWSWQFVKVPFHILLAGDELL